MRIEIILFNILLLIFLFILIYLYMYINYSNNYEHFEDANPSSVQSTSEGQYQAPPSIEMNGDTENAAINYPSDINSINNERRNNKNPSLICTGYYWFRMPISGPKLIYFITNGKNDDPVSGNSEGGKNIDGPWMLALRLVAGSSYLNPLTADDTLRFFIRNSTINSDSLTIYNIKMLHFCVT